MITQTSIDEADKICMFAILVELDHKSMENYLSFIQYNGNEVQLAQLETFCNKIDFESLPAKCSGFYLDMETLVDEHTTDQMVQTTISRRRPPIKCVGQMNINFAAIFDPNDTPFKTTQKLYKLLGDGKIEHLFLAAAEP